VLDEPLPTAQILSWEKASLNLNLIRAIAAEPDRC
jgi:hypothetical protein